MYHSQVSIRRKLTFWFHINTDQRPPMPVARKGMRRPNILEKRQPSCPHLQQISHSRLQDSDITHFLLVRAKRREWMGCWGLLEWLLIVIDCYCGSFPHSLLSTSKIFSISGWFSPSLPSTARISALHQLFESGHLETIRLRTAGYRYGNYFFRVLFYVNYVG